MTNKNEKQLLSKINIILIIQLVLQISCQPPFKESQTAESDSFIFPEQDITPNGYYNIERMLKLALRKGAKVKICGACAHAICLIILLGRALVVLFT